MSACATTSASTPIPTTCCRCRTRSTSRSGRCSIKFVTGMTIAMILHSKLPWRNLMSAIMLLPWIVPEIVTALAWKSIYDPLFGGLNPILQGMGIIDQPLGWLSDSNLALGSVIAVNVWKGIPFFTLLLLAGLKAIDTELYESAERRRRQCRAALPLRHAAGHALRHPRGAAAELHFHLQPVRPDLPDDRRRPERRDAPLLDPRLREGDRLAAVRSGQRHRALRGAADGLPHLPARQVHAARRARGRRREEGPRPRHRQVLRRASSASCSTSSSGRSTCSTAASRSSAWCCAGA